MKISAKQVTHSRELILANLRDYKATVIGLLQSGERDFQLVRNSLERYIDLQIAADALAGHATIESGH